VNYIYTGGMESGVFVGLIQYPPFPEEHSQLLQKAIKLGEILAEENCQWSFTVVSTDENIF
jgi:hypothetical protein